MTNSEPRCVIEQYPQQEHTALLEYKLTYQKLNGKDTECVKVEAKTSFAVTINSAEIYGNLSPLLTTQEMVGVTKNNLEVKQRQSHL